MQWTVYTLSFSVCRWPGRRDGDVVEITVTLLRQDVSQPTYFRSTFSTSCVLPVLAIRDILVWIQIRGSVPLTNGSGSDSFLQ